MTDIRKFRNEHPNPVVRCGWKPTSVVNPPTFKTVIYRNKDGSADVHKWTAEDGWKKVERP